MSFWPAWKTGFLFCKNSDFLKLDGMKINENAKNSDFLKLDGMKINENAKNSDF